MKRKRKIKYLSPPMKFNPGTVGFEPDLPSLDEKEKKVKMGWFWLILLILALILSLIFLLLK